MARPIGKIRTGRTTVATAGTAVQLQDQSAPVGATGAITVTVQALGTNTNPVVVGDSSVKAAPGTQGAPTQRGIRLAANDSISIDVSELGAIWVDSITSGDGVTWIVGAA